MRVLFRGQVFQSDIAAVAKRCNLDYLDAATEDVLFEQLGAADALWITPSYYTPAVAEALAANRGPLRWLALTSGGYDVLARVGVPAHLQLTYAAGVHAPSVAEHAVAQLLALVRQFPTVIDQQREHKWSTALVPTLRSLEDMTVAIVGFGSIGRAIGERLRPLAKRIVGITRSGTPDPAADEIVPLSRLDDVLATSDAVVLAVSMNDDSVRLLDARRLALLPDGAFVVNIARGTVIETSALVDALNGGKLGGAALDVTEPEPLPTGHPLWSAARVLITPHVSSFGSRATAGRLAEQFARNVARFERGEKLEGLIRLT
jgi:phosphoglycerate dehydrogenase-like enzyme